MWELKTLSHKTDLDGEKKRLLPDKNIPWPCVCAQRKSCKTKCRISPDDFGLRSPVIQKPFQAKGATSIVARVEATCS